MDIQKSKSIFFSPARKTGNILSLFVSSLGYDAEKYNKKSYKAMWKNKKLFMRNAQI